MKRVFMLGAVVIGLAIASFLGTAGLGAFAQTAGYIPGTGEILPYPIIGTSTAKFSGLITALAGVNLPVSTVAGLPTCNAAAKGTLRAVSDATTPTYNGTLTGGGAVVVPVFCNGSAWTSH